ncbi:hypothetical protein D3C85_1902770 [compost metagenome]
MGQVSDVVVVAISDTVFVAYLVHIGQPAPDRSGVLLRAHAVQAELAQLPADKNPTGR